MLSTDPFRMHALHLSVMLTGAAVAPEMKKKEESPSTFRYDAPLFLQAAVSMPDGVYLRGGSG